MNATDGLDLSSLPVRAEPFFDERALREMAMSQVPSKRLDYMYLHVDFSRLDLARKRDVANELLTYQETLRQDDAAQDQVLRLMAYVRPVEKTGLRLTEIAKNTAVPSRLRARALVSLSWYWEMSPTLTDAELVERFLRSQDGDLVAGGIYACQYARIQSCRNELQRLENEGQSSEVRTLSHETIGWLDSLR